MKMRPEAANSSIAGAIGGRQQALDQEFDRVPYGDPTTGGRHEIGAAFVEHDVFDAALVGQTQPALAWI